MLATRVALIGMLLACAAAGTAEAQQAPVDVSRLPVDLVKVTRQLRQTTGSESRQGLHIRYTVEWYGAAPTIEFFTEEGQPGDRPRAVRRAGAPRDDRARHAHRIPGAGRGFQRAAALARRSRSQEIEFIVRMRILVVAATRAEIAPLVAGLRQRPGDDSHIHRYTRGAHEVDVLATGVGMVATAARCSRALASGNYDVAFNFGICGSFDPALPPASVVHVVTERLPELGAEDGDAFLTAEELNLVGANRVSLRRRTYRQRGAARQRSPRPSAVRERHHGQHRSRQRAHHRRDRARCAPQVESMEGAAFMYSCLIRHLPCAEVRAVSNVVERRNRGAWKVQEAIAALGDTALAILDQA